MQRRVVDTVHRSDGPRWEDLAGRALAISPPYRPVRGCAIYHVRADNDVVLVAEHDLCGPLLDLVTAVLAMGDAMLTLFWARSHRCRSNPAGGCSRCTLGQG
jgi:hypothetical protein